VSIFWLVIALLPLGLGLLVLFPVLFAATFCSYKDIFLGAGE
jgi:uncharacterized membrane protein